MKTTNFTTADNYLKPNKKERKNIKFEKCQ